MSSLQLREKNMKVKHLKSHLQIKLLELEKMDEDLELKYFTMDEGGYTDGLEIDDFDLDFTEEDGELSCTVTVVPTD